MTWTIHLFWANFHFIKVHTCFYLQAKKSFFCCDKWQQVTFSGEWITTWSQRHVLGLYSKQNKQTPFELSDWTSMERLVRFPPTCHVAPDLLFLFCRGFLLRSTFRLTADCVRGFFPRVCLFYSCLKHPQYLLLFAFTESACDTVTVSGAEGTRPCPSCLIFDIPHLGWFRSCLLQKAFPAGWNIWHNDHYCLTSCFCLWRTLMFFPLLVLKLLICCSIDVFCHILYLYPHHHVCKFHWYCF